MSDAIGRVRAAYSRMAEVDRPDVWITVRPIEGVLAEAGDVDRRVHSGETLPLAGSVVAVKDNIDVAGLPTTAGCPSFAAVPELSATAVRRLCDAGAVVLGKTNMDQFATGLVGTRSPYGAVRSAVAPDRIAGGSSSGSAVAVALGVVDIGLATDTAGSGRIPAAFNGIVGLKPAVGVVPTDGVVPACRSFDCVSVFTRTIAEADIAIGVIADPARRRRSDRRADVIAVPDQSALATMTPRWQRAFADAIGRSGRYRIVTIDFAPFLEIGRLLYEGALVAERYAAVGAFLEEHRHESDVDPIVRDIILGSAAIPAHRLIADTDRLRSLRVDAENALGEADVLIVPTAPEHPTSTQVSADPVAVNNRLGRFTTFANLLGLCAVAVPVGMVDGVPFGVTVLARGDDEHCALDIARQLTGEPAGSGLGRADDTAVPGDVELVVVGAHLSDQPLAADLRALGGRMHRAVRTTAEYRMFLLPGPVRKPGLVRCTQGGEAISGELWRLPAAGLGALLSGLPSPMSLGRLRLDDGSTATGFLCESAAVADAEDISGFGDWRSYLTAAESVTTHAQR